MRGRQRELVFASPAIRPNGIAPIIATNPSSVLPDAKSAIRGDDERYRHEDSEQHGHARQSLYRRADALEPPAGRSRGLVGPDRRARGRRRPRRDGARVRPARDRGADPRASSRCSRGALDLLAPGDGARRARPARRRPGRPLAAVLRGRQARLGRARRAHVLRRTDPDRRRGPVRAAGDAAARSCSSRSSAGAAGDRARRARRRPRRRAPPPPLALACGLGSAATFAVLVLLSKRLLRRTRPPADRGVLGLRSSARSPSSPFLLLADRVVPAGARGVGDGAAPRRRVHRALDARLRERSCAT